MATNCTAAGLPSTVAATVIPVNPTRRTVVVTTRPIVVVVVNILFHVVSHCLFLWGADESYFGFVGMLERLESWILGKKVPGQNE